MFYLHLYVANEQTGAERVAANILFVPVEKFNHGVSAESKKLAWAEITNQINALGENHREVWPSARLHSGMILTDWLQCYSPI